MSECIHCVLPTPGVVSAEKLPTDNKSPLTTPDFSENVTVQAAQGTRPALHTVLSFEGLQKH